MTATAKYLHRYAEPEATILSQADFDHRWRQVLVVPAYRESAVFLENLDRFSETLLILVLNRPDTAPDATCNDELRSAALSREVIWQSPQAGATLAVRGNENHVLLLERPAPLPSQEGVGLARKLGCDAALALHTAGRVASSWMHCSDGDAVLPDDYFDGALQHPDAVALTYPFAHELPHDPSERRAMQCYEEFLCHYVEGLRAAGSPYAFFTLGSCLAVKSGAYAKVRGFPKRAAGEDFYLLNKLAKLGAVETPACDPIRLSARLSERVPFGTGPALRKLLDGEQENSDAIFYDPRVFSALRLLLCFVEDHGRPGLNKQDFVTGLEKRPALIEAMLDQGLSGFLHHANAQCADESAFKKQFHQWFDGFRTLKLIHALSENYGRLTFDEYRGVYESSRR